MVTASGISFDKGVLTEKQFTHFASLITGLIGIKMPPRKKNMLQNRIMRRLRALNMDSFEDYYNYVFKDKMLNSELEDLINAVTTNKTDFFREPRHFEYLYDHVLPDIRSVKNNVSIWCAGCSTGEEIYSLAMTVEEFSVNQSRTHYSIVASDISTKVLLHSSRGIYDESRVSDVPQELKKKYFLRSKDRSKELVRICPEIRNKVKTVTLNFMDNEYKSIPNGIDIVFFRNVLIYFDAKTQEEVLSKVIKKIRRGGYIFTGHSESIKDMRLPLKQENVSIYRKI